MKPGKSCKVWVVQYMQNRRSGWIEFDTRYPLRPEAKDALDILSHKHPMLSWRLIGRTDLVEETIRKTK